MRHRRCRGPFSSLAIPLLALSPCRLYPCWDGLPSSSGDRLTSVQSHHWLSRGGRQSTRVTGESSASSGRLRPRQSTPDSGFIAARAGTTRVRANAIATTPRIGAVAVTANSNLRPRAGHPESLGLGRRIAPCCLDVGWPGEPGPPAVTVVWAAWPGWVPPGTRTPQWGHWAGRLR